jgi:hypothetical protein
VRVQGSPLGWRATETAATAVSRDSLKPCYASKVTPVHVINHMSRRAEMSAPVGRGISFLLDFRKP